MHEVDDEHRGRQDTCEPDEPRFRVVLASSILVHTLVIQITCQGSTASASRNAINDAKPVEVPDTKEKNRASDTDIKPAARPW
jgi:hypothetical protein